MSPLRRICVPRPWGPSDRSVHRLQTNSFSFQLMIHLRFTSALLVSICTPRGPDLASAGPNSKHVRRAPKTQIYGRKKTKNPKITKIAITLALIVWFEKFKKFWKADNLLFAGPLKPQDPMRGKITFYPFISQLVRLQLLILCSNILNDRA